ncbi:MAG: hypothetical protein RKP73_03345 [Candidatus Contendobacter sp.]|nr:hypothetical protein [Candidatus Contendobacter sp.]
MNRLFAFILFIVGLVLVAMGACGNLTDFVSLNAWGMIWRIGLGVLLIVLAVLLANIDSISGPKDPF